MQHCLVCAPSQLPGPSPLNPTSLYVINLFCGHWPQWCTFLLRSRTFQVILPTCRAVFWEHSLSLFCEQLPFPTWLLFHLRYKETHSHTFLLPLFSGTLPPASCLPIIPGTKAQKDCTCCQHSLILLKPAISPLAAII